MRPGGRHGGTQGLEHADRQHEGRLSHGLAAEHVVFAGGFGPELDVQVLGLGDLPAYPEPAETERTLRSAVGPRGWSAYQRYAGDWLKQVIE